MIQHPIRVRFAPSPTGNLHVGGLRTALFNWLFAKHNKGVFLLRIEDTDPERSKPEYTAAILEAFDWVSLASDEPIVVQSARIKEHMLVINKLLQEGKAYRCFCTPQELENRLGPGASREGGYAKYDQKCRTLASSAPESRNDASCAIRFKLPEDHDTITFDDLIHGPITFDIKQLDDFIIVRSDGTPMYNFVVVVDDAQMGITHVLRGEEHIANTPKQILLYQACGYTVPAFGHVPFILGPDGHKLSKREAATSVLDYKRNGFLPDALCNYLVRLGWSHGDQEIFTRQELIDYFSLDHVGKKGAIFDIKKLEWLNSVYLRQMSAEQIVDYITQNSDAYFRAKFPLWSETTRDQLINLYKERVKTVIELIRELESLYAQPQYSSHNAQELHLYRTPEYSTLLGQLTQTLADQDDFSTAAVAAAIKKLSLQHTIALSAYTKPLRLALTGKNSSPGVFELAALLGKQETISRLHMFIHMLTNP